MLVELTLFLAALVLGLIAAVLGRPKPPALDAARLLAVCRSALIWGREEQGDDPVAAWTEGVGASLIYHPAARQGWAKLDDPAAYEIPVPSLPGERSLVESLAGLEPGRARFDRMFHDDGSKAALLDDPNTLGEDYDPGRWLGHGCDWEVLARWGEPAQAALARRLQHHHLVLLAASEQLSAARALLEGLAADATASLLELEDTTPEPEAGQALAARLLEHAPGAADRLVHLVLGDAGPLLLEALARDPVLRDRTAVLIFDGCPLGGVESDPPPGLSAAERLAWTEEHFTHEALDTELRRSTPYCFLARLQPDAVPAGDGRTPWPAQRLQEPPVPPSNRRPVAVVDLGAAHADRGRLEPAIQGRSLLLLLAFLLGEGAPRPEA